MPGAARLAAGRAGARTRAEGDIFESRGIRASRYPSLAVSEFRGIRVSRCPSLAVSKSRGIRVSRCPSLAASESRCIRVSRHPSLAGSEPRSIRVDPARTAAGLPGRIRVVICPAQHAAAGVITSGTSWMPRCTTRVSFLHLDFFQVSSFNCFSCLCLFMVQHNLDAPLYYLGHHTPLYDLDALCGTKWRPDCARCATAPKAWEHWA